VVCRIGEIGLGDCARRARRPNEGIEQVRESISAAEAAGGECVSAILRAWLADALRKARRFEDGLAVLAEASAFAAKNGDHWGDAEIHRIRGELSLESGGDRSSEAEAHFREAINIARRQSAKSWELRAVTSLARLLQGLGRREEARARLAEIYAWFTEGFDTADLKDAKALLEELS